MKTLRKPLLGFALLAVAVLIGFFAAAGLLSVMNFVLPPFQIEDNNTLREFIPVLLAYLTWGITSLIAFIVGVRRIRRIP